VGLLTAGRPEHEGPLDRWLLLLSVASGIAYLVTRPLQPFPGSGIVKGLGMAPLAVLGLRVLGRAERAAPGVRGRGIRDSRILAAALSLSCLGDVLLHVGGRRSFLLGLGAFLLAHVAYVALFARRWPRPLRPAPGRLVLAAAVVLYAAAFTAWLAPGLESLSVPVLAYAAAITAMAVAAIFAGFSTPLVVMGALLFVLSDSLIAAGRFRAAVPLAGLLIWPAYYLGQYLITMGVLRDGAGDAGRAQR
jgi:uncharacterized membrane protein YhhN